MNKTVLVVSADLLFPNSSGGRVAILGQCRALIDAGYTIELVVFHRDELSEEGRRRHLELTPHTTFIKRRGFIGSLLRWPFLPYQTSSRIIERKLAQSIRSSHPPVVIMAHQEWTLPTAARLAGRAGAPIVLCSQNDEFEYLGALIRNGSGLSRAYHVLEFARLRLWIASALRKVDVVTVLSAGDRGFYEARGLETVLVRPVLTGSRPFPPHAVAPAGSKIIFVGSLDLTHTVAGLLWFTRSVLPLLRRADPKVTFHVAGRRATDRLRTELDGTEGVVFHGEIADLDPLYEGARVFVNPVFDGSGINMKMGTPSELGLPIVSTSVGVRGLGDIADATLHSDDAQSFSEHCLHLINDDDDWLRRSALLQRGIVHFSQEQIGHELEKVIQHVSQ